MDHDLQISQITIVKMATETAKLTAIYRVLRKQARFRLSGDYPLISWIASIVSTMRDVSKNEITKVLKVAADGEFKDVRSNSEIVHQIYAPIQSKNGQKNGSGGGRLTNRKVLTSSANSTSYLRSN